MSKPEQIKNEMCNSANRNDYKRKLLGDAHCRGVRIVINSTFTAGGISAPIFVTVYGLTKNEMPNDDIITIIVPGLVAGGHQDLYSSGEGFLSFVRGNDGGTSSDNRRHNDEVVHQAENQTNRHSYDSTTVNSIQMDRGLSKESQVASLYRQCVYYPFIKKIRKDKYNYSGDENKDIPDHLRAISWMDGCSSQLKLITSPENVMVENELNITCCKHSAARTAVEQAADAGCMFKETKRMVHSTATPHSCNNSV